MEAQRRRQLSAVAAMNDPQRSALYDFVRASTSAVSRDDVAAALGIPRSTAAFQLDRLVEEGLLVTEFRRLSGKTGPGSGRPSKLYRRADDEIAVSVPERHYELMAELLAAAVDEADAGTPARESLIRIAHERGRDFGADAGALPEALVANGYEPRDDSDGGMVLVNCPFHRLAARHTELVCAANHALLQGAAESDERYDVVFDPAPGQCCVRVVPRRESPQTDTAPAG